MKKMNNKQVCIHFFTPNIRLSPRHPLTNSVHSHARTWNQQNTTLLVAEQRKIHNKAHFTISVEAAYSSTKGGGKAVDCLSSDQKNYWKKNKTKKPPVVRNAGPL